MTLEDTKRLLAALEREQVEYVLVGSMAMAVLGLIRATEDMDFFVSPRKENIERLKEALQSVFHDPHIDEISAEDLAGDYPSVQYVPPSGDFSFDILTRLGEAFRYEELESQDVDLEGIHVRVATPAMLYRMKKDTVRPRDRVDAAWIRKIFGLDED